MTARSELYAAVMSGGEHSPARSDRASARIDAFRAEVLAEAAEIHGGAHRKIAEVLDYLAEKDAVQLSEDAGAMGFHIVAILDGPGPRADEAPVATATREQIRAEALAEAKVETVAWLVKKAAEQKKWDAAVLASKIDRGAVRIFLGTGHYRDAMDAHRAEVRREVLAEAAGLIEAARAADEATYRDQPAQINRRIGMREAIAVLRREYEPALPADSHQATRGEPGEAAAGGGQLDRTDWVFCSHRVCRNGERRVKATERGWHQGPMDAWLCPQHAPGGGQ